jgi:poly(3-hydroxybutyrate) depolymerase
MTGTRDGSTTGTKMLYQLYQPWEDASTAARAAAGSMAGLLGRLPLGLSSTLPVRSMRAAYDVFAHSGVTHDRPPFGIDSVVVGHRECPVVEKVVMSTPFGSLVHFAKPDAPPQPTVLVVAPISGHFSTLLRATVATLSTDHDVYVTDWHNARDIPVDEGAFGFDDCVLHIRQFLEHLGGDSHVVAVCQPCVPALAAVALLAQDRSPAQPRTMTLMAGPIDTRINPTAVNELATSHDIGWFERNVISTVPAQFAGAGRRVYPGFLQLTAFMSMNLDRHVRKHLELWGSIVRGDDDRVVATREFYDEYFAVLDLPAEFYLDTVHRVFQTHELARGVLEVDGVRVDPAAIRRTALLTVEGERDDICSVGQTMAAHDLCLSVPGTRRMHHHQAGVGHYGVFSGSRWETQIAPRVRSFILAHG